MKTIKTKGESESYFYNFCCLLFISSQLSAIDTVAISVVAQFSAAWPTSQNKMEPVLQAKQKQKTAEPWMETEGVVGRDSHEGCPVLTFQSE